MTREIKWLGLAEYGPVMAAMKAFTETRQANTPDEIWVLEHSPVYTLGLAGKTEHLLHADLPIPVVRTDRGGQVTYHGPGQLVIYPLVDFKRLHLGVRDLVRRLEQAVIDTLSEYGISARGDVAAPGVYVDGAKVASLGLRIKNGAVYHGLSLNVNMDLTPFAWINPCGYPNLRVIQLKDLGVDEPVYQVATRLLPHLEHHLTV